ncbi:MAG: integration host factor subunit beta [Victivallaceae bacterium]|nr:integration host factor subunit beta [Victivallaceae bacterium]
MKMTKRDLVIKISEDSRVRQKDVMKIVQMTLDGIADEVSAGGTVELRNFGVFKPVLCKSRPGRNPNNPEQKVTIPARMVIKFRAGKELKERVNKLQASLHATGVHP